MTTLHGSYPTASGSGSPSSSASPMSPPPPSKATGKRLLIVTADSNRSQQPVKKLTPSCAYCRAKKIKCDTREPCNNCIAKGLEAECRKDERVPRGRKRSRQDKVSVQSEIAQLKSRLQDLQGLLPRLPSPTPGASSPPTEQPVAEDRLLKKTRLDPPHWAKTTSTSAASTSSLLASKQGHDADEASRTVEQWAATTTNQANDVDEQQGLGTSDLWRTDTTNPYWADSTNISIRVSINREASEHLPDTAIVDELMDLFFQRCNPLCGSIVFEPRFRRLAVRSCKKSGSTEHIMTSPLYIDPSCWAILFLVMSIALSFYPYESEEPTEAFHLVNRFRREHGEEWTDRAHDYSRRCLALQASLSFTSTPAIQAACLMVFRARESDAYIRQLLRLTIGSAQALGYHRMGSASLADEEIPEARGRKETVVRIWSFLCVRDWCSSIRDGTHAIQPQQSSTRGPLDLSDDDIQSGMTAARNTGEWTSSTYAVMMYSLAQVVRELNDARLARGGRLDEATRNVFYQRLLRWLWGCPPCFQVGSTTAPHHLVSSVQRWMLHQQVFNQLLTLCRGSFASRTFRESAVDLARSVLVTHNKIISVCPIAKGLWSNGMHLLSAGLILGFDLLDDESSTQKDEATRATTREQIGSAMESIYRASGSQRGSLVLGALLEVESMHFDHRQHQQRHGSASSTREVIDFSTLSLQLIRTAATRTAEPIYTSTDFQLPERAHDAVLPALGASTLTGNGQTGAVDVEAWQQVAREMGMSSFASTTPIQATTWIGDLAPASSLGATNTSHINRPWQGEESRPKFLQTASQQSLALSPIFTPGGSRLDSASGAAPSAFTPSFVGQIGRQTSRQTIALSSVRDSPAISRRNTGEVSTSPSSSSDVAQRSSSSLGYGAHSGSSKEASSCETSGATTELSSPSEEERIDHRSAMKLSSVAQRRATEQLMGFAQLQQQQQQQQQSYYHHPGRHHESAVQGASHNQSSPVQASFHAPFAAPSLPGLSHQALGPISHQQNQQQRQQQQPQSFADDSRGYQHHHHHFVPSMSNAGQVPSFATSPIFEHGQMHHRTTAAPVYEAHHHPHSMHLNNTHGVQASYRR